MEGRPSGLFILAPRNWQSKRKSLLYRFLSSWSFDFSSSTKKNKVDHVEKFYHSRNGHFQVYRIEMRLAVETQSHKTLLTYLCLWTGVSAQLAQEQF